MPGTDENQAAVALSDERHPPQNERAHEDLAELEVPLHEGAQMLAVDNDDRPVAERPAPDEGAARGQHVDLARELAGPVDDHDLVVAIDRPHDLHGALEDDEEAGVLLAELEQHLAGAEAPSLAERGDAGELRRREPGEHLIAAAQIRVTHVIGGGAAPAAARSFTIHPRICVRVDNHPTLPVMTAWLGSLRRWPRTELSLGLRSAVAGLITYGLGQLLGLPQVFWAVLTAVMVMQESVGASLKAVLDRLAGTFGGAVWGVAVAVAMLWAGLASTALALAVTLVPLALLAALRLAYRVAPVSASSSSSARRPRARARPWPPANGYSTSASAASSA